MRCRSASDGLGETASSNDIELQSVLLDWQDEVDDTVTMVASVTRDKSLPAVNDSAAPAVGMLPDRRHL